MKTPIPTNESDRLRPLLPRLESWLVAHRPRFLAGLNPPASDDELRELDRRLGTPVPAPLRALLAWHNGQGDAFAGAFVEDWRLMSTESISAASPALDADADSTGWQLAWVPFLDDDAGSYVCLDPAQPGTPVREFWLGNDDHPVVAPSLEAWLRTFVETLEAGGYVEDPERGTLLREDGGPDGR